MLKIYPFRALVPADKRASEVACPPYDVLSTEEAQAIAEDSPASFVRVIRPDVDPSIVEIHSPEAYAAARDHLNDAIKNGVLVERPEPAIYLYRQATSDHAQTGIVCCYDVEDYREGRIKKHETTKPDKEQDRVDHMLSCRAHPEPVLLTFPSTAELDDLMEQDCQTIPIFDFAAEDGVQHTGWQVQQPAVYAKAFESVEAGYIADGHHRTAAGERVATELEEQGVSAGEHQRVLSVFFPIDQLRILAYNRAVLSTITEQVKGLSAEHLLSQLAEAGEVAEAAAVPQTPGQVCFYLDGQWRSLTFSSELTEKVSLIERLDVALLQNHVLNPVFGVEDPRTNPHLTFVGGSRGTAELEAMVDRGDCLIAFSMYPTDLEDLVTVSDMGDVMPPKSTWFDPKLRSGLFVHRFETE